jgi:phage I-like protein
MELEQLQAELREAKEGIEALKAKNTELLSEKRKLLAQNKEAVDYEKYQATIDELDNTKSEFAKLQKQFKSETEKLSATLNQKDSTLQNVLIDNGLVEALSKAGVKPEFLEMSKSYLKQRAKLVEDNGSFKAMIDDKPLSEYIDSWKESEGKSVIAAPANNGGGATGGNQGSGTHIDIGSMSATELMKQGRSAQKA